LSSIVLSILLATSPSGSPLTSTETSVVMNSFISLLRNKARRTSLPPTAD
jgi:hypothetical protein